MNNILTLLCILIFLALGSCKKDGPVSGKLVISEWVRDAENPVFRDLIPSENYQAASDPHVFYDEDNSLKMIYTGDANGVASIKLATATSINKWEAQRTLLSDIGPSGKDVSKETAFYRKSSNGKHQIYYIGYEDETTYQSEVYLAEADELEGPYTQLNLPVVSRGNLARKEVYLITSPSIMEHEGKLYISFLGWNESPENVTEVWVIGAISSDDGHTWSDFRIVDTPIGMEGQVTKVKNNEFVAVRTASFNNQEAIFYATSAHPFGPWEEIEEPVLIQEDPILEKNEIIAPQITIDQITKEKYLFYTGADYQNGWWIMLARKN